MDPQFVAIGTVQRYVLSRIEKTDAKPEFQLYVVWFAFTLGNWKALISTTLPDGMYYEVTYNCALDELYLDAYKKFDNVKIEQPMRTLHDDVLHDITSIDTEVANVQ